MRYLIYIKSSNESFFTQWFGDELVPDEPYVCFDLAIEWYQQLKRSRKAL